MEITWGTMYQSNEPEKMTIETNVFTFRPEWFGSTVPSIHDLDLFLPEWEDKSDTNWVMMYFIAECYQALINDNFAILCAEAKTELLKYKAMIEPDIDKSNSSGERI